MNPPTWTKRDRSLELLRIMIAGLSGYLITALAGITDQTKMSPILIAFIVGYSIDVFFALLDTFGVSMFEIGWILRAIIPASL